MTNERPATPAPTSSGGPGAAVDPAALGEFTRMVWLYKQGEMVSLMLHLGDRLGLFAALDGGEPLDAAALAARTGLHERWLLEWLRCMAGAQVVEYLPGEHADGRDGRFLLTEVAALVLARDGLLTFAAGVLEAPKPASLLDNLERSFRTGLGMSYDDHGVDCAHHVERMLGPMSRALLVPAVLPALDGVADKLAAGAVVADVGCGAGLTLRLLAEAFPASRFHGYDVSRHAIEVAAERNRAAGLANIELHHVSGDALPGEPTFDLVLTFDCLHDMTRPDLVIAAIAAATKPDGTWLVKDIRSSPSLAENLRNPMLPMMYGSSICTCMSSALSEPGGLGLGTLGFHPGVAEQMARAAGFTRFRTLDLPDPANLYYEIRF